MEQTKIVWAPNIFGSGSKIYFLFKNTKKILVRNEIVIIILIIPARKTIWLSIFHDFDCVGRFSILSKFVWCEFSKYLSCLAWSDYPVDLRFN